MRAALREVAAERHGRPAQAWFSVAEAARALQVGEETLRRCIKAGEFPCVRLGGRYLVPAQALEDLEQRALSGWKLVEASELAVGPWNASGPQP